MSHVQLLCLVLCAAVSVGLKHGLPTVPAMRKNGWNSAGIPDSWLCDDSDYYCDGGGACCPLMTDPYSFNCAGTDPFATCPYNPSAEFYCPASSPIVCDQDCCDVGYTCRDNACVPRLAKVSGNAGLSAVVHTKSIPAPIKVGSFIPVTPWFGEGILRQVSEGLHNVVFPVWSDNWRSESGGSNSEVRQCYVIGFPKDAATCLEQPWHASCAASSASMAQIGNLTFDNTNPFMKAIGEDSLEWCNDDPNTTATYMHSYQYTETQSVTNTLTETVKTTVGMKMSIEIDAGVIFEEAKEKFEMDFSVEIDVSSSTAQTQTKTRSWTSEEQVPVGPRRRVIHKCWVQAAQFNSPFHGRVKIESPIVWSCQDSNGPNYWFSDNANWYSRTLELASEDKFGFSKEDFNLLFSAGISGTFQAVQGFKTVCKSHTVFLISGESCNGRDSRTQHGLVI